MSPLFRPGFRRASPAPKNIERPPWCESPGLEHGEVAKTLLKSAPSCREPSGVGHSNDSAAPLAWRDSERAALPPCADLSPG